MSKKGSDGFQNRAAMKFKQPDKIDLMTQQDIFKIFDDEIDTILDQVTANREHRGKYPTYVANAFANLSTALWFKEYVNDHCKITKKGKFKTDLTDDQVESLRTLLAEPIRSLQQISMLSRLRNMMSVIRCLVRHLSSCIGRYIVLPES